MVSPRRLDGGEVRLANGAETHPAPASKAIPIASRGIRTTTDIKRVAFALAEDVLTGSVAPKVSGAVVSALGVGLRTYQLELRAADNLPSGGGGIDLLDSPQRGPDDERKRLLLEQRQRLDDELAAIDASGQVVN